MTTQLDLLAIAENPHPLADEARARIRAAIIAEARQHGGRVDPNRVRARLSNANGLEVPPRMLSATYSAMAGRGELSSLGYIGVNDDQAGGNAGKPQRVWLAAPSLWMPGLEEAS
jgi:hypothetical protein